MKIDGFEIEGPKLVTLNPIVDSRGYFMRTFDVNTFQQLDGSLDHWVQENQSFTKNKGTLRGLHFQRPPYAEKKLVRVLKGAVQDVIVDVRKGSPTYGRYLSIVLAGDNPQVLFVPEGFAHGFLTLSDDVLMSYKVSAPYEPSAEVGINCSDSELNIDWKVNNPILSDKDRVLPLLADIEPVEVMK